CFGSWMLYFGIKKFLQKVYFLHPVSDSRIKIKINIIRLFTTFQGRTKGAPLLKRCKQSCGVYFLFLLCLAIFFGEHTYISFEKVSCHPPLVVVISGFLGRSR